MIRKSLGSNGKPFKTGNRENWIQQLDRLIRIALVGVVVIGCMAGQTAIATQAPSHDELARLDDEGRLTVRALMGWGALPDRFKPLIFEMRSQGHDLLGADAATILSWLRQDGSEQTFTPEQRTALRELATFMVGRNYLEQSRSEQKKEISADELRQPRDAPQVPAEPQETAPAQVAENLTLAGKVFDLVAPCTVVVVAHDARGEPFGQGSGVIFASNVVATNCHTLEEARSVSVNVEDRKYPATILHSDWERDVCSLSVPGLQAEPVRHGSTATLRVGSRVYAVGAPKGLELTLSEGIVSSLRDIEGGRYIQTTAPISPGSSGGGLYDHQGRLVGLTTFLLKDSQNLNFALPVEWIHELPGRHTARQSSPEDDVAWIEQASAISKQKDWPGLVEFSLRWTRAKPNDPVAWYSLGIGYQSTEQWLMAIEAFEQSLEFSQNVELVWYNLGITYLLSDQANKSIFALERAAQINPDSYSAWYHIGIAYRVGKKPTNAIFAFQRAAEIDSSKKKLWYELGLSYIDINNFDDALKCFYKSFYIDELCKYCLYYIGLIYFKNDKNEKVVNIHAKISRIDKELANKFYNDFIKNQNHLKAETKDKCKEIDMVHTPTTLLFDGINREGEVVFVWGIVNNIKSSTTGNPFDSNVIISSFDIIDENNNIVKIINSNLPEKFIQKGERVIIFGEISLYASNEIWISSYYDDFTEKNISKRNASKPECIFEINDLPERIHVNDLVLKKYSYKNRYVTIYGRIGNINITNGGVVIFFDHNVSARTPEHSFSWDDISKNEIEFIKSLKPGMEVEIFVYGYPILNNWFIFDSISNIQILK